jgi:hypothetical protein
MRRKLGMIASGPIDRDAIAELVAAQERSVELAAKSRRRLTAVEEADLEDELADRMEELGVAAALDLAPVFVAAGSASSGSTTWPARCAAGARRPAAVDGLHRRDREPHGRDRGGHRRISTLVAAVKQYSYMDSARARTSTCTPASTAPS